LGEESALFDLIRKARHRHAFQLLVHQVIFGVTVALGGFVALLLLGTQVLSAIWLAILFLAGLCFGLYRAKGEFRPPYLLAQGIDSRLDLRDTLSTAVYYSQHKESPAPRDLIERQRRIAEQAARQVDLRLGLPFMCPKSLYAGTCLAMLALTVFGVRYGVTKSMDLHASLVQIAFNGLLGEDQSAAKKKGTGQKKGPDLAKESSLTVDPWESKALDQQGPPETALNTIDTPEVNNQDYKTEANAKAQGMKSDDPVQQPAQADDSSDKNANGDPQNAENQNSSREAKQGKQDGGEQQDKQGNSSSGENSSLAQKMRDALSSLMSKLKTQPKQDSKQSGSQSQQAQNNQGSQDKSAQSAGKPQAEAQSSPDQQGQQEGQSSDKAASAQNKSGKSSDRPPNQDGKSGIGKEDGDKSAREAEQQAAMGKISEIIGKRAANMTGEVMVEVSSGNQQLRTQYSQRKAAHTDAGGEIGRDEVPLAYQQFVQQYFEEVRKAPATTQQTAKPKTP
jgi:hypothetical protein